MAWCTASAFTPFLAFCSFIWRLFLQDQSWWYEVCKWISCTDSICVRSNKFSQTLPANCSLAVVHLSSCRCLGETVSAQIQLQQWNRVSASARVPRGHGWCSLVPDTRAGNPLASLALIQALCHVPPAAPHRYLWSKHAILLWGLERSGH